MQSLLHTHTPQGHLLFEMACGYELTSLVPGDQEYKSVKNEQVKLALQFVFEDGFPHSLEEVCRAAVQSQQ